MSATYSIDELFEKLNILAPIRDGEHMVNGGFETGVGNWGLNSAIISTTNPHNGSKCAVNDGSALEIGQSINPSIDITTITSFTCWVRSVDASTLNVNVIDVNGDSYFASVTITADGDWYQYDLLAAIIASGFTTGYIALIDLYIPPTTIDSAIDDVSLLVGSTEKIINGGFEDPFDWDYFDGIVTNDRPHSGTYCLTLDVAGILDIEQTLNPVIDVTTISSFTFWLRSDESAFDVQYTDDLDNSDNITFNLPVDAIAGPDANGYYQYDLLAKIRASGFTSGNLAKIEFFNDDDITDEAIDDVSLLVVTGYGYDLDTILYNGLAKYDLDVILLTPQKYENQEVEAGTIYGMTFGDQCFAQTFTAQSDHTISQVKLFLQTTGNLDGLFIGVAIFPTIGGLPDLSGSPLASTMVDATTLYAPWSWKTFDMDTPCSVTSGTKYAIVIAINGGTGFTKEVDWEYNVNAPYAGGAVYRSIDSGVTWRLFESYDADFLFQIWS